MGVGVSDSGATLEPDLHPEQTQNGTKLCYSVHVSSPGLDLAVSKTGRYWGKPTQHYVASRTFYCLLSTLGNHQLQ